MCESFFEGRRRFFLEQHALEDFLRRSTAEARRGKRNDCSQDHPGMFCDYLPMLYLIPFLRIL